MCDCFYHKLLKDNSDYINCPFMYYHNPNILYERCMCELWKGKIPKFHEKFLERDLIYKTIFITNMFKGPISKLNGSEYLNMLNNRIKEFANAKKQKIDIQKELYFENDISLGCHIKYYIDDQLRTEYQL